MTATSPSSLRVKICPGCPESKLRAILSTAPLYYRSDKCLECHTDLLILQKVDPNTRSGGCRRVKLCRICMHIPARTKFMVDWQGAGQSQWGCITKCSIEKHGALAVFHERESGFACTPMNDQPVPIFDDTRSIFQPITTSQVAKRKREVLGDLDNVNDHACGAPQSKKTKIVTSSPASRPAMQEESDTESFENFEEEYAYYAAKVRRLLGEDPTKPRTYPRSTSACTKTKPVVAQSSTPTPTTTSTEIVKPVNLPPSLPSRPPISDRILDLQFGDNPPAIKPPTIPHGMTRSNVSEEPIRVCLPPTNGSRGLARVKDNKDCGCSTILCVHRAGERQSVKDVSIDGRR